MKTKKLNKKLSLNKTVIANLDNEEQIAVKGGYWATELFGGCTSWHPICPSKPDWVCPYSDTLPKCIT